MITVSVKGTETINQDVEKEIKKIDGSIPVALYQLGSQFGEKLETRLRQDWYEAWKPKNYPRRTDFPIYGIGIMSDDYKDYSVNKNTLTFIYEPKGDHGLTEYHTRDNDELIKSIETGDLMGNPPPRPFWENFVDELMAGDLMDLFITAMKPYNVILDGEDDKYINLNESYLI